MYTDEQEEKQENSQNEVGNSMKDNAKITKTGANLAKKVSTGNALGVAKNGLKLLTNKKFMKRLILQGILSILPIIIAGAILFGIFSTVGDAIQDLLEGAVNGIVDFFTIDHEGAIDVKEEQIDTIINTIADMGIDLDGLKLMGDIDYNDPDLQNAKQEALRKYIKEFYEAQAITETLNTKPGWFENWTKGDKIYGSVYIYRLNNGATDSTDSYQLDYLNPTDFETKVNNQSSDIIKYFTTNDERQLVFATVSTSSETGNIITVHRIDYKNVISQYTTKMNFFLYLAIVSENPEFVSAVADLVKKSEINITIMENTTKRTTSGTYTYTPVSRTATMQGNTLVQDAPVEGTQVTENLPTTTNTFVAPKLAVTYAKTWFCEQTITYTKKQGDTLRNENIIDASKNPSLSDDEEKEAESDGQVVTWNIKKSQNIITESTQTTYEEGTRGDVIDKTGNKGDGKSSFIGLLDVEFKIPNSTRYEKAGENIVSGADLLLYLLQKDDYLQNMEQIMRYVLYKYTGNDYGVTNLDFNIFNAREFTTVSARGNQLLTQYIHQWEHSTPPPTNADGTKYIIEDDGKGHPTVGYGIDIFNGGFATLFEEAGYPTSIGGEVDKEFVDALEKQEIELKLSDIKAITAGLDLKEYQIHALVSRAYNCGTGSLNSSGERAGAIGIRNGKNFVEAYNAYWNEETDDQFEEQNSNANYNHSLYTQYMSLPVTSDGDYLAGLENRRKSEWKLFQTGYYDVLGKWYQEGGDILTMCEEVMNDLLAHNVHYSLSNLVWNNIEASNDFSRYGCCCATYVSVVLYRAGLLEPELINRYNYNYTGTIDGGRSGGVNTMMRDAGWIHVSEAEAEPGDICVYDGHAFIYAGGNDVWDQQSGCISSSGESPKRGTYAGWSSYINSYNVDVWRKP